MLREIELQQKAQREYFELFIKKILEAFDCSQPPAAYYSLKVLFKEPLFILAIAEATKYDKIGFGLTPVCLEVTGIEISYNALCQDCFSSLRLEAKIEGGEIHAILGRWRLTWEPSHDPRFKTLSKIEILPPEVSPYYLFSGSVLRELLQALEENAQDKAQRREYPQKEEVVHPC